MAEKWSSGLVFILAAIGSAVGIGNIWRFPAVLGQNGGGAYLLPYLLAVLVFAIPLMVLELAVGRHFGKDLVSSFIAVRDRYRILGYAISVLLFLLMSYYLVITGWTLAYMIFSIVGTEPQFPDFITTMYPVLFFVVAAAVTGAIVYRGVKGGIERIVSAVIPLSFAILIALAVYSSTLEGFSAGVDFLFTPDFSVLSSPALWSAAFGQAFFSLSVGYGILITYGSYMVKKTNIPRSSLIITSADISVAMLSGLIIFPIAFTVGLEPSLGVELAFVTLPVAFDGIPSGQLLAIAFFSLLFFAALTSAISMMEVNIKVITSRFGLGRERTTILLTVATLVVGLPSALSYSGIGLIIGDQRFFDLMDLTVGSYGLPIAGTIISLAFSWGMEKGQIQQEIGSWWGRMIIPLTRYVVPTMLISITLLSMLQTFLGW